MDSNQWQRIEELFHAASELPAGERGVFLERECSGDEALRCEVESLIAAPDDKRSFIEQSALTLGMKVLSSSQKGSLVGESIGHYKIVKLLGEGGMGEVYLAEDRTLERQVALKFLAPGLVDDGWAREQLMKEARAVARLENPNICAVHGLEEIGEYTFIVMQYVEGETLASLLRKEPLELEPALDLGEQIIGALSAAHLRGLIHRDVKPQNIVVTAEGQAKVLDFGLAKFVRRSQSNGRADKVDQTSHQGFVVGTVAYMSPEQTQGDELDCRSDIFSFGIVFYQMLGGRNPFQRDNREDTIAAIRTEDPPPLPAALPEALTGISRKCLEKRLERRYQTADELLGDLHSLRKSRERAATMAWRQHLKYYALAAALIMVVLVGGIGYVYRKVTTVHTLAVLPIANMSGDPDKNYLSEGLTRNLFDKFSYLPRLELKLPSVAASTQNEEITRVGRELKVEAVLSGEIVKQGQSLVLLLTMLDTANGKPIWQQTFNLDSADMLSLQDDVTRKVTASLGLWLIGDEKRLLTKRQTANQEALTAYMHGRFLWGLKRDRENIRTAIQYFDQAINLDPSFAKAYAGRADCYVLMTGVFYGTMKTEEAMNKASYDARQAIENDPSLAEGHTSMGSIKLKYDWDWERAEKEFELAINLNPDYAPARYWYSNLLVVRGRFDEAVRQSEIARSLDPYSRLSEMNYGRALYYSRRFDEAGAHFAKVLQADPNYAQYLHMMGLILLQQKRYPEAIATFERLQSNDPNHQPSAALGYAYGKAGRPADALLILKALDDLPKNEPVPPLEKALVYIGMGDKDKAFEFLEAAYRDRFANLTYLNADAVYDDLRSDPRFVDLTRRIGLTG
jgi:tetratricopeptide (TPR) repeat protein